MSLLHTFATTSHKIIRFRIREISKLNIFYSFVDIYFLNKRFAFAEYMSYNAKIKVIEILIKKGILL